MTLSTESILERARRLRPLVPNCVTDRALRLRIAQGWDDHQIVTHDLVAPAEVATVPTRRSRRPRHAYLGNQRLQVERALFSA